MGQSLLSHCLPCCLRERKTLREIAVVVVIVLVVLATASLCAVLPGSQLTAFAAVFSAITGAAVLIRRASQG
jgi:type IV secretory pathway component VirB8